MISFKENELQVDVKNVESFDDRYPTVEDEIATDYLYDLDDFKQVCDDLSESQNGYYMIEENYGSEGEYKIIFFSSDDTDDFGGKPTGYAIFDIVAHYIKAVEKFFE